MKKLIDSETLEMVLVICFAFALLLSLGFAVMQLVTAFFIAISVSLVSFFLSFAFLIFGRD